MNKWLKAFNGESKMSSLTQPLDAIANLSFEETLRAYHECHNFVALARCCLVIETYIKNNRESCIVKWETEFVEFEKLFMGVQFKQMTLSKTRLCHSKTLVQLALRPNEIIRWYTLRSHILYRLATLNLIPHETRWLKLCHDILQNACKLVRSNKLLNKPEFIYLYKECKLRKLILCIDYLNDPWSGYAILKRLKKSRHNDTGQIEIIDKYLEIAQMQCSMWYLRRVKGLV
jgi:hypothetical protein